MTLDPAGVEKAAKEVYGFSNGLTLWDRVPPSERAIYIESATDILTAYFSHLRESGKMREAFGYDGFGDDNWQTYTSTLHSRTRDFPALIIRTEKE